MSNLLASARAIIISGGSSGIGAALIASLLTINKKALICNLSRSKPAIKEHSERVFHFECDLTDSQSLMNASGGIAQMLSSSEGVGPIILVNNSGFGAYGLFQDIKAEDELAMIDLNIRAVVDLSHRLLPLLLKSGGAIVNIASTAAFQATPTMASYGASKAFLVHWSLALNQDLKGTGVQSLCVCPGPTSTNFFKRAGFDKAPLSPRFGHSAEFVAKEIVRAIHRGQALRVCGWMNWFVVSLAGCLPKPWSAWLSGKILKRLRLNLLQ